MELSRDIPCPGANRDFHERPTKASITVETETFGSNCLPLNGHWREKSARIVVDLVLAEIIDLDHVVSKH